LLLTVYDQIPQLLRVARIGIDGNAHNHKLLQAFLFQSVSSSAHMKLTFSMHTPLDDHFEEALHYGGPGVP
jgi:hypothetical protein